MKIEIQNTQVEVHSGNSKAGRPYSIRRQGAYAHVAGAAYPVAMKITLQDNAQPFSPGFYELCESSFYVGRYGELAISNNLILKPTASQQRAA